MRNYSCKPVVWKRRLWFRHRDIQTTRFKDLSHMRRSARCCAALVNHKKRFYQRGNAQRACERPFTYYLYKWHMTSHIHLDTFNIFIYTALYTYLPSVLWRWLVGRQEGHPACKNWVVRCWHGYLSGARCRLAYGPDDAIGTHCLLLQ